MPKSHQYAIFMNAKYQLHLKGYVGGYDFDSDYVDYILSRNTESEVHVLIDSLGGSLATALSIVAAFRQHGNVHVHFVGMNASAATIASLGAKHISIDSSAMYLVHKCSMEFFQWASANSDKLSDIIKEARQMKSDLDKMDANVAEMYAAKCQKNPEDLLELMKKGGWLTAKEALEWGFVDEITDYEEDAAPVITDSIAADMAATGIPVPAHLAGQQSSNRFARFIEALTNLFTNTNAQSNMEQIPNTPQSANQQAAPDTQALEQQHAQALAEKDNVIAQLRAELEALKKAPGASTSQVVEDEKKNHPEEQPSEVDKFFEARERAKELYNMLP